MSRRARQPRPYYTACVLDRRRWRKELRRFILDHPEHAGLSGAMWEGDDSARLALSDAAEENGEDYLAMFLRRNVVCSVRPPVCK